MGNRPNDRDIDTRPPSRLPSGITEEMIANSLGSGSVKKKRKKINTGKGIFSRIREEDRDAAELALRLEEMAEQDDPLGVFLSNGPVQEVGVNGLSSDEIRKQCQWLNKRKPRCGANEIFRRNDGSCNNLINPLLGVSGSPFQRIATPTYGNNFNTPRLAQSGRKLPSPRFLTQNVLKVSNRRTVFGTTTLFVQMGQFIDHDLTLTPEFEDDAEGEELECCEHDSRGRPRIFPDNFDEVRCVPIRIPDDDPFWGRRGRGSPSQRGRTCYEARRSLPALGLNCEASSVREQTDALTHWLDSSNVYGSTEKEARDVREPGNSFFLKADNRFRTSRGGRSLLPSCDVFRNNINACGAPCNERTNCRVAGDQRVNEQAGLATLHTVWLREHNRIARELENINRNWGVEKVFQESRRILNAEWQHIIYKEWLPILLGKNYTTAFDLTPLDFGYTNGIGSYNEEMDPRINNEFATAAFRFGHSMMPREVPMREDAGGTINRDLNLRDVFNNVSIFKDPDVVNQIVRGQMGEASAEWDPAFNEDLVNSLFGEELDLGALNINRGRDHGLPGYNSYREICQSGAYGRANSFQDLSGGGALEQEDILTLQDLYDDVDDIDLFVGGTLEVSHLDALLGPAFTCIIGDQFLRLKEGDRFYYEHGHDPTTRFSLDLLGEIRKVSMARIICDNTDIEETQPNVFMIDKRGNRVTNCDNIPEMDLRVFTD